MQRCGGRAALAGMGFVVVSLLGADPRFAPVLPAFAQTGTATAENVRIETPSAVISIPHIEARGTSLSSAELFRIFDPKDSASLADRLAKFSFDTLTAPEVIVIPGAAGGKSAKGQFTFRNLTLSQSVAGKIKAVLIEGASLAHATDGTPAPSIDIGKISASNIDLALAGRIEAGSRSDADAPLLPLYDSFSIAAVRVQDPSNGSFEIGPISGQGLKGRPLLVRFAEMSRIIDKPAAERTEVERHQVAAYAADSIASFSFERLDLLGLVFAQTRGDDPVTLKLGKFVIEGFAGDKLRTVAVDDFSVVTKEADVSFARAALEGLDEPGLPEFIKQATAEISPAGADYRRIRPKLTDMSLQDLHIRVPVKDSTGNSADGAQNLVEVPAFEMKVSRYAGAVPADLSTHVQMIYDIAPTAPSDGLRNLARAGFSHFDISSDAAMSWDEKSQTAKIDHVSVSGKNMGSVTLGAQMSNVSSDLFGTDKNAIARAAQQIRLRAIDLAVTNEGLAEKGLSLAAASANTTSPVLKAELIGQIDVAIIKALGPGPVSDQLMNAITLFINDPKNLKLAVKVPAGLNLEALTSVKDPKDLLDQIEVSATANR